MIIFDLFEDNNKKTPGATLAEFAPSDSSNGDDGFSEETLKQLAAQWYNGDEDPEVERTLMAAGWEIGQDEGYDDEPGVFVVQAGDVNGNSYISWPADELRQDVAEEELDEIDRRGFLKGMGAAAVAGAAGGADAQYNPKLNPHIPQDLEFLLQTVDSTCALYYYIKIENPKASWANDLTTAISKFSRKDLLKEKYPPIYRYFQEKKVSDPNGYANQINSLIKNQRQIIQDLNSLSEFNESVEQGVAEAEGPGRVDPILYKALARMTKGGYDDAKIALAIEVGLLDMKHNYAIANNYIPKLVDLYNQKHGVTESALTEMNRRGFLRGLAGLAASAAAPAPILKLLSTPAGISSLSTPAGVTTLGMTAGLALLKGIKAQLDQYDPEDDDAYFEAWEDMAAELGFDSTDADGEYIDPLGDLINLYNENPKKAAQQLITHIQSEAVNPDDITSTFRPRDDWRQRAKLNDPEDDSEPYDYYASNTPEKNKIVIYTTDFDGNIMDTYIRDNRQSDPVEELKKFIRSDGSSSGSRFYKYTKYSATNGGKPVKIDHEKYIDPSKLSNALSPAQVINKMYKMWDADIDPNVATVSTTPGALTRAAGPGALTRAATITKAGIDKLSNLRNKTQPAPTVKDMGPIQRVKPAPALPAPTTEPELNLAPNLKQKVKTGVTESLEDYERYQYIVTLKSGKRIRFLCSAECDVKNYIERKYKEPVVDIKDQGIVGEPPVELLPGEIKEGSQSFHNGMQVKLTPEYADRPDEVFTVAHCDRERGRCWIGDEQGRGWYASFDQLIPVEDDEVDEGWRSTLGAAALAGTMALGAGNAHGRVAGDYVDNPDINRLTGKPKVTQTAPSNQVKPVAPSGFSSEYLQSVVDGTHPRPMISVEKAQELLNQIKEGEVTKTATGIRHRSTDAYGGTKDTDHLRTLDKSTTNKIDRALGVKFNREKKWGAGLDLTNEVSPEYIERYKKEHGKRATAADQAGDYAKGHEHFKKINKLTKQQFQRGTKPEKVDEISNFMTQPTKPVTPEEQWKRQIRLLAKQYQTNAGSLAALGRENGPDSAEAVAYEYLRDPSKIRVPGMAAPASAVNWDEVIRRLPMGLSGMALLQAAEEHLINNRGMLRSTVRSLLNNDENQRSLSAAYAKKKTPAESVTEESDNEAVEQAIARRIMVGRTDLLLKYGPRKVMQAVEEVADYVGSVDEIGTSDVSGWVAQVERTLGGMSEAKATSTRLDPKCWTGKKIGNPKTKVKGGVRVNNCVPAESVAEDLAEEFNLIESIIELLAKHNGVDAEVIWEDLETLTEDELYVFAVTSKPIMESQGVAEASIGGVGALAVLNRNRNRNRNKNTPDNTPVTSKNPHKSSYNDHEETMGSDDYDDGVMGSDDYNDEVMEQGVAEDWQKANKRDKTDGMSQKAVNAYRRENPGSKLKTAVTTKPSKLKKGSKASKRRKSYCSRSKGQMNMHNISCAKTPDKAICKARRRWNC